MEEVQLKTPNVLKCPSEGASGSIVGVAVAPVAVVGVSPGNTAPPELWTRGRNSRVSAAHCARGMAAPGEPPFPAAQAATRPIAATIDNCCNIGRSGHMASFSFEVLLA
jgi:hypothetical protein